jgi:hypothetical protein
MGGGGSPPSQPSTQPTREQLLTLIETCEWESETLEDRKGRRVLGPLPEGPSFVMPMRGAAWGNTDATRALSCGPSSDSYTSGSVPSRADSQVTMTRTELTALGSR